MELEERVVWRCGKLATLQRHGVNVALMSLFLSKVSNHHEDQFLLALMRQRLARGMLLRSENVPLQSFKGHFAMVLLEMQPDGDGSSSVMFTAHIGDVGVGWKCSWASSSETVETVRYSDS